MKLNSSDIFVGLWSLYYLQGIVYPEGIINQLLLIVLIVMQVASFIKALLADMDKPIIATTSILLLMYIIYGLIILLFGDGVNWTPDSDYLKRSLLSLMPILFFYYETQKHNITEKRIKVYTIIVLLVGILKFNLTGQLMSEIIGNDEVTNNIGYMFVAMIPMLFFYHKQPWLQYLLLMVLIIYIFLGMKRGAVLIGVISSIIFIYGTYKNATKSHKLSVFILAIVLFFGTIYYVENLMDSSDYFVKRIEQTIDGNTSARDEIYGRVWNEVKTETRLLPFLFGRGANSTIYYAGDYAHQDWLETFCNNGIFGVILLLAFFISFGVTVLKCNRSFMPYMYYSFLILFFLTLTKTLFSMSIQNLDMYQGLLIGYLTYYSTNQGQRNLDVV